MSKEKYHLVRQLGEAKEAVQNDYNKAVKDYLRDLVETKGEKGTLDFFKAFDDYDEDCDLGIAVNEDETYTIETISLGKDGEIVINGEFDLDDIEDWAVTDFLLGLGEFLGDAE